MQGLCTAATNMVSGGLLNMKRTERSPIETATKVRSENVQPVRRLYNCWADTCDMGTPGSAIHLQARAHDEEAFYSATQGGSLMVDRHSALCVVRHLSWCMCQQIWTWVSSTKGAAGKVDLSVLTSLCLATGFPLWDAASKAAGDGMSCSAGAPGSTVCV